MAIKNVALFKFNKNILAKYLFYYLEYSTMELKNISIGAVQAFVSLKLFRNFLFPLPPLSEQTRIVSKIEEVFALLDEIERELA